MPLAAHASRLFAAVLLLSPVAASAEETALVPIPGERVALAFKAYKGGFRVLEVEVGLDLTEGDGYEMAVDVELVGAPALLFTYELAMKSEGQLTAEGPVPRRYRTDSINGKKRKPEWLELTFDDRGNIAVSGDPLPEKEARPKVTAGQRLGALDPITGMLSVLLQAAQAGTCNLRAPVFDGRRRFDVVLEDAGIKELPKSSINIYSGPARLCQLTVKTRAGYRYDGRDKRTLPKSLDAYLASPAPGLPEMPVRLIVRTGWGTVLVHLVEVLEPAQG